jgi:3-isopropylmalate/(R)-2-methylmalate dehydratase large subunit
MPEKTVRLTPGKRILFLTKDPETVRKQLRGELDLQMKDVAVSDLMDDINTDAMAPAWACFDYRPDALARSAYAGITVDGERLFRDNALIDGNFEVIVSGKRKGVGSSREQAVQAEKYAGIRIAIADGFAPIHARNNINSGVLMAGHDVLMKLQAGEEVAIEAFMTGRDPVTRLIIQAGGLFAFTRAVARGEAQLPMPTTRARPMTIAEKILHSRIATPTKPAAIKPGDAVAVNVDGGFSHDFTSAQVHYFLTEEYGEGYKLKNPVKFAVFEDHMLYAQDMPTYAKFRPKLIEQSERQRAFQEATGVRAFLAKDGVSPGICHTVAREKMIEPGDFIQATDSHTCMGGSLNSLAYGVGATEYAALVYSGITFIETPGSIRFELKGALRPGVTAKDVMLFILKEYAKPGKTLDLVMEFGGPGLAALSPDERATMANMATECAAKAGVFEGDQTMVDWIVAHRHGADAAKLRAQVVTPDPGAEYVGGTHVVDLSSIEPMVATPGDAARGISSDPTNGALVKDIGDVRIDIAYGGSCTAGKEEDLDMYARVMTQALAAGKRVAPNVNFFIQFGSESVEAYATAKGYLDVFARTGVKVIKPGCGACIGCGPGISENKQQVTVSAINRNYQNRSGPGSLYLASPLTVAASAVMGKIVAYEPEMFGPALH